MRLGIPPVETAHDRHRTRIRSPHAEHGARFAIVSDKVSPHLFVHAVVAALIEEVQILISKELGVGESGFGAHGLGESVPRLVYRKTYGATRGVCGITPRKANAQGDFLPYQALFGVT